VQKRILPVAIIAITFISLIGWNCTKLDTTDIGGDQLPAVDNVHTFDTTLLINSSQGYFNDSTTAVGIGEDHALGSIFNDPIFGRTTASVFMQVKPSFYPYYFGSSGDTIVGMDSIVLCLKYNGFWGDSLTNVHLEVREVIDAQFRDSFQRVNPVYYKPFYVTGGSPLGAADINARRLADTVKYTNGKNYSVNQVRIKITDPIWINRLFARDSTIANSSNNAFYKDSIFKIFYNGLAVVANGIGNGLLYVNLADTATKLEIHYRRKKSITGTLDTTYSAFRVNSSYADPVSNAPASSGNYITHNRIGFPANVPNTNVHYLQTGPGTFVNLTVPGLATFPNSIIHRAEVIVEQVPESALYDSVFSAPNFLYLDLKDSGVNKYKPVYYDLNTSISYDPDNLRAYYFPTGGQIDFNYFGGYKRKKTDANGTYNFYTFNISRYIQHLVTEHRPNYGLRLYAPFNIVYPQYSSSLISYSNNIAYGRVKIGSATNTSHPLKLRIIYSKL
jgi:Domain of unknown function (DUF4270)